MQELVDFAREKEMVLVHDFAYADLGFDGYTPPSIFEADRRIQIKLQGEMPSPLNPPKPFQKSNPSGSSAGPAAASVAIERDVDSGGRGGAAAGRWSS